MLRIEECVGEIVAASTQRRKNGPIVAGGGREVDGSGLWSSDRIIGEYCQKLGLWFAGGKKRTIYIPDENAYRKPLSFSTFRLGMNVLLIVEHLEYFDPLRVSLKLARQMDSILGRQGEQRRAVEGSMDGKW